MLKTYDKLRIPDENKVNDLLIEVNWNPNDKETNDCKFLRVTMNGKTSVIKKEHFYAFLFAIGNESEQMKMIPKVERRSRWYETVVSVVAKNDVKKGQNITFPIKLTLPTIEEEVIGEMKKDLLKQGLVYKQK